MFLGFIGAPSFLICGNNGDFDAVEVHKFVMFTNPEDIDWAEMREVVALLRKNLEPTGCVVLDCGEKQCEILPPGVNKGLTGRLWRVVVECCFILPHCLSSSFVQIPYTSLIHQFFFMWFLPSVACCCLLPVFKSYHSDIKPSEVRSLVMSWEPVALWLVP